MIKKLAYLIIITLCICCKSDNDGPDCSVVTCPALSVVVNLVDNANEENIIIKNNITKENIIIRDTLDNQVEFTINETNGFLHLDINSRTSSIEILIDSETITSFSYDISDPKTNECCDFGEFTYVLPDNQTFELNNYILTIYL